ncbi:ABC transporter permease [Conexibacter sp. CPCC 206217]|uniref:ABC transporter permease n=1 Tax=Conexibacter sp. CPCC 206217 TaxID=3064574 RepID=UPI00271DC761|nr:ABC transporter permease [Conexibacter sp. CPCC 206217]MDO8210241.1 ABC transporter permease [Conexibacter sp. CPCC 206217]
MTATSTPLAAPSARRARRVATVRALLRRPSFLIGAGILLFWVLCALFGQALVPDDPYATNPADSLAAPSAAHWFGTDALGRDVFSRVIVGARAILTISLLAAGLATLLGTTIGLVMGYVGGLVDDALSRLAEAVMALPSVILALLALTALGPSNLTLVVVVGFAYSWVIARTVRAAVLTEREGEYVAAARVRGERAPYIMFGEILPNVVPIVIVEFTVRVGMAVFSVASLSFLGFGVQPPSPDWGLQIADSYGVLAAGAWWTALFPALAIASLVVSVFLVADNVQGALSE